MTTAPVRPIPTPNSQLTVRTGQWRRGHLDLLVRLDLLGPDLNQLLDRVSQLSHMASRLPKAFRRRNHPDP